MKPSLVRAVCVMAMQPVMAQGSWIPIATSGPPGRYGHAMAYDSQRGRTVLFGGSGNGVAYLGDTWEFDGVSWWQVATSGPGPRFAHAMAYDSQRGRTVLCGGSGATSTYSDTWEWDGSVWLQVVASGPSGTWPAMAYDSQRARTVMFNGGGTYEWDGASWTSTPVGGPSSITSSSMAYDSARARTLLYATNGTWEWDGATWAQVASPFPFQPWRAWTVMAYDSVRRKTVLFGGYTTGLVYTDTSEWDGLNWAHVGSVGPSTWIPAMAYDSQRGRSVLFIGGTYEWAGAPGTATVFGSGCGSPPLALSSVVGTVPTIGTTPSVALTNIPSTLAFVALGWSRSMAGPFALPMTLAGYGMPGCDLLQSAETPAAPVTFTSASTAIYSLPLPNWSRLIGMRIYLQGWAYAPGANTGHTIVSNGIEWTIGF